MRVCARPVFCLRFRRTLRVVACRFHVTIWKETRSCAARAVGLPNLGSDDATLRGATGCAPESAVFDSANWGRSSSLSSLTHTRRQYRHHCRPHSNSNTASALCKPSTRCPASAPSRRALAPTRSLRTLSPQPTALTQSASVTGSAWSSRTTVRSACASAVWCPQCTPTGSTAPSRPSLRLPPVLAEITSGTVYFNLTVRRSARAPRSYLRCAPSTVLSAPPRLHFSGQRLPPVEFQRRPLQRPGVPQDGRPPQRS